MSDRLLVVFVQCLSSLQPLSQLPVLTSQVKFRSLEPQIPTTAPVIGDMAPPPLPSRAPSVKKYSSSSAIDDRPYRLFTDEHGVEHKTQGALLPREYKKHSDPESPYICPVQSCRDLLPTMAGLGRHFNNKHRGECLNDNLDGTLSIIGTYADRRTTDGRHSGGVSIPAIVVSKGHKSLEDSPMASPVLNCLRLPQGSRRSAPMLEKQATDRVYDVQPDDQPDAIHIAIDNRAYNKWPDEHGILQPLEFALLPARFGTVEDKFPDLPWLCPIRSCQKLHQSIGCLDRHWEKEHGGCCLQDNLDGTLTILPTGYPPTSVSGAGPARIVVRGPGRSDPVVRMKRKVYSTENTRHGERHGRWEEVSDHEMHPKAPEVALDRTAEQRHEIHDVDADAHNDNRRSLTPPVDRPPSDPHGTWEHICSRLERDLPIPDVEGGPIDYLLQLPRLRPLYLDRRIETFLDDRQLMSMIVYIVGVERPHGCTKCRLDSAPFDRCVTLSKSHATTLYHVKGANHWQSHSCARCLLRESKSACSLECSPAKDGVAVWNPKKSPQKGLQNDDAAGALLAPPQSGSMPTSRGKSSGTAQKRSYDDAILDAGGDIDGDGELVDRAKRRREDTGSKSGPTCGSKRPQRGTVVAYTKGVSLSGTEGEESHEDSEDEYRPDSSRQMLVKVRIPDSIMPEVAKLSSGEPNAEGAMGDQQNNDGNSESLSTRQPTSTGPEDDPLGSSTPRSDLGSDYTIPGMQNSRSPELDPMGPQIVPGVIPLEMQDWECNRAARYSIKSPSGSEVARHPTPGEIVHLSADVSLTSQVLPSGGSHRFPPHDTKTRVCTVISGGLRVKMDGLESFSIGPGGFFKVEVNVGCTVENRFYVAAAMHVIAMQDAY
ncbi:hypothetical protein QBC34DRAFT_494488 [Podospora aff. communis PSN243]|uniref:C2H2-type domain-containing protein n=1 Tax=Podospora aff. communis PSN243 TaxID=3040156 RepID=A0AAV9GQI9_9PEZI|nr:hypothetical protein QBC34DRAFT_494488 [Podospora aff. communis PSN243]